MSKELQEFSPFNQKELRAKITLVNFLIIMKFLKEKNIIKKNGKFPPLEYRHEGRSSYEAYFVTALRKALKYFFTGMDIKKQRSGMDFKIYGPSKKVIYDAKEAESISSKLALLETTGSLQNHNFTRFNQSMNVVRRSGDFYIEYKYHDQAVSNYSPVDFFTDQAREIQPQDMIENNHLQNTVLGSLALVHSKFLANPQHYADNYINAENVQSALNNLNQTVIEEQGYSEASRRLLIDKIRELRDTVVGLGDSQLFDLARMHLSNEPDINQIEYNDIYNELAAA